jgi:flagellar hook-associated protein 1 FlgK
VTFAPTNSYAPGASGNAVYVDCVPVTGAGSPMPSRTGVIAGLADLRDRLAPQYQSQLDNIARGLISSFSEQDQGNPPTLPPATGLFSWSGSPTVPGQPAAAGLAASIRVDPTVDPAQGGDPTLLRDGGIAGAAYITNPTHSAGDATALQGMISALSSSQSFDAAAGIAASGQSVESYAAASNAWLASERQQASNTAIYQDSVSTQAASALSNATGVNLDSEMSRMLEVENAYQASAKLLSTIDGMMTSLLNVTSVGA